MLFVHVTFVLYLLQKLSNGQVTLTTANDDVGDASITILGAPDTVVAGNQWDLQTNSGSNDWSLWFIGDSNTWGFSSLQPQRFELKIFGETISTNDCDMIITFTDGLENEQSKYFTIALKLDDNVNSLFNTISPGCGTLAQPTPLLNTGLDPYYTMLTGNSDDYFSANEPSGDRACRAGYNLASDSCPFENMGPAGNSNTWPLEFYIDNFPAQNITQVTFFGNGYDAVTCVFKDIMVTDAGIMIYITVGDTTDEFSIQSMFVRESVITSIPTTSPTTTQPTNNPSKIPSNAPSISPLESTESPSNAPSNVPSQSPSKAPSNIPSSTPSASPTTELPTTSPSSEPSLSPTATTTATTTEITTPQPTTQIPSTSSPTDTNPATDIPTTNIPTTNTPTTNIQTSIVTTSNIRTSNPSQSPISDGEGIIGEVTLPPTRNDKANISVDNNGAMDINSILMIVIIVLLILILCGCILVFFKKLKNYWALRDQYETYYSKYNDISPIEDSGAAKPMMIDINYMNENKNENQNENANENTNIEQDKDNSPRRQSRAEGGVLTVPQQIQRYDSDDDIMDGANIETRIGPDINNIDKDTPNSLPKPPPRKISPRKDGIHHQQEFIDALIKQPQPPMVPLRDIQRIKSGKNDSYDQDDEEDIALINDENKQYDDDEDDEDDMDIMIPNKVTIDGIENKLNDEDDYDDNAEGLNKQKSYDRNGDLIIDENIEIENIEYNNINERIKQKGNKKKKESESESYIINGSESEINETTR